MLSVAFTVTLMTRPDNAIAHIVAVLRDETERWNERRDLLAKLQSCSTSAATETRESSGGRDLIG